MNEYLLAVGHLEAEAAKQCPAGKETAGTRLESIALHALMHLKCVPRFQHTNLHSSKCLLVTLVFCHSTIGKEEGPEKDSMDEGKCN